MGAALTGLPVVKIIETWGWDSFFMVMAVASFLSAVIILPIMNPKSIRLCLKIGEASIQQIPNSP